MITLDDLMLRPMVENDLDMVLVWRNANHVRRHMYTDHLITAREHRAWFEHVSNEIDCEHLIAELRESPLGVVSFTQIDRRHGTCFWGFYIGVEDRPRGGGSMMEVRALDRMVTHHAIRKISCEVIGSNAAVVKMHKRFGFEQEGVFKQHIEKNGKYEDVCRLALFAQTWPEHRANILRLLSN